MTKDLCRITGPYGKQHLTHIKTEAQEIPDTLGPCCQLRNNRGIHTQESKQPGVPCLTGLTWLFCICLYFLFLSSQSCHPSATSRIIIREKPRAKERTPMFE